MLVHLNGNPESGSNNHSDFEQMAELARSHARRAEQPYITQPGAQAEWDELEARKMHIALSTMYANLAFLVKE